MKLEDILSYPPKVLSEEQRNQYFRDGYLLLPGFVSSNWLNVLNDGLDIRLTDLKEV